MGYPENKYKSMQLNGHDQQKLLGHTGRCFDIRYSSDGNFLLSASEDGTAILWDVKTRKVRRFRLKLGFHIYLNILCFEKHIFPCHLIRYSHFVLLDMYQN